MEKIYPAYKEADVVVLASPLYYWFISGFLKNAFDRLFAVAEGDPGYRNPRKQSVLIMAAEGAGFEESEHWYDHLERHIGWKSLGKVLCGHVTQPGDTEGRPELKQAYDLGKSIKD
jgi:multimeric flavodoxin WrbA